MKKLIRKKSNMKIAGVCGALADYSGIDVSMMRLLIFLFIMVTGPIGLISYIAGIIIIPLENNV